MSLTELARTLSEVGKKYDEADAVLKAVTTEYGEAETALLNAMVEEGVNSIQVDGIGLFSLRTQNYLSVNVANKPQFFKYLQESGNADLLKLDVNPKTLTSWLGEHLDTLSKKLQAERGLDNIEARQEALKFLNEKGANYFQKRGIAIRKG